MYGLSRAPASALLILIISVLLFKRAPSPTAGAHIRVWGYFVSMLGWGAGVEVHDLHLDLQSKVCCPRCIGGTKAHCYLSAN